MSSKYLYDLKDTQHGNKLNFSNKAGVQEKNFSTLYKNLNIVRVQYIMSKGIEAKLTVIH